MYFISTLVEAQGFVIKMSNSSMFH